MYVCVPFLTAPQRSQPCQLCSLAWSFSHAFAGVPGAHEEPYAPALEEEANESDSPLPLTGSVESAKLPLPMAAEVLFGVLAEELLARRGELSETEQFSCELAFRRLGQLSPFGALGAPDAIPESD